MAQQKGAKRAVKVLKRRQKKAKIGKQVNLAKAERRQALPEEAKKS